MPIILIRITAKRHGDWYETPKDESLVIKFTTSDEEKKDPENKE